MKEVTKEMPRKIEVQDLPWGELEKIGITQEGMDHEQLNALCKGDLTDSLKIRLTGGNRPIVANGRLGGYRNEEGKPQFRVILERVKPNLEHYKGHNFPPEEREQLFVLGRTVNPVVLSKPDGTVYRALCEIDPQTNVTMITPLRAIYNRKEIAQTEISPEQMEALREGRYVHLTGLKTKNGDSFNADIYYSAVKDDLTFMSEGKYQALENKLRSCFAQFLPLQTHSSKGISGSRSFCPPNTPFSALFLGLFCLALRGNFLDPILGFWDSCLGDWDLKVKEGICCIICYLFQHIASVLCVAWNSLYGVLFPKSAMKMSEMITKDYALVAEFDDSLDHLQNGIEGFMTNRRPILGGEHFRIDREVSARLKVSLRTLLAYRNNGIIAYYRLGGKILYKESDISCCVIQKGRGTRPTVPFSVIVITRCSIVVSPCPLICLLFFFPLTLLFRKRV